MSYTFTYLCSNSMGPCRKQFSDTSCLETFMSKTKCCTQSSATCSNNHGIIAVINHGVFS